MGNAGQTCFVIMPFAVRDVDRPRYPDKNHWSEVYEGLIAPAVKEAGLRPERDDYDFTARQVTEGIWRKIEQAKIILCDLSSHNPNVHLELGWAMRAEKLIVLIKDDVTEFSFDLNQHATREYLHTLQPSSLKKSIAEIAQVISATLDAGVQSSTIGRLRTAERATELALGSVEVTLLQQVLAELQSLRSGSPATPTRGVGSTIGLGVAPSELPVALIGSTWRKTGGLEEILFAPRGLFWYHSVGSTEWLENDYRLSSDWRTVDLTWRHDGYVGRCRFDEQYSHFTEQDGIVWWLVAKEPFRHPSFGPVR